MDSATKNWNPILIVFAVLLAALVPSGCPTQNAQIEVNIDGLPEGAAAKVLLSGPGGTIMVDESKTVQVAAGTYTVLVAPANAPQAIVGNLYTGTADVDSVTVSQTSGGVVNVQYAFAASGFLLAPDYGNDVIGVVNLEDLEDGTGPSAEWWAEGFDGYTGVALGPDGRLYVASYDDEAIFVIDIEDATSNGAVTPILVLTSDDLQGPSGLAFDHDGNLWVGEYYNGTVLKFNDVASLTEDTHRDADVVLTVNTSQGAEHFYAISDIYIDHNNHLWVADLDVEAIYRFENIQTYSGSTSRIPALFLTYYWDDEVEEYNILSPMSLVVDRQGRLYVGNYDYHVSRFDNASSLSGYQDEVPASAYIYTGYVYPHMVTLDQSGALWTAHYYGELTRIVEPESLTGYVEPDLDIDGSWSESGSPDGGRIIFVPTPDTLFGF